MNPIRCHGLSKSYRRVRAVDRLNLEVPEGSIFGLVGPNGAGKTTAIRMLMNISRPDRGSANVLGCDSRRLSPGEFARIGYVSENQTMPDWMSVEYLMAYLAPFYPSWDRALAGELLRRFGLPADRRLGQLSRGMRMKAALASSLAYRPRLLVLDEPFSGLDPLVREDLIQGILTHAGETTGETTMLISSHDLGEIESFASHIGFMESGRLLFSEGMTSLTERFREIEIVAGDAPAEKTGAWPAHWLGVEVSPAVVRFVETQFHRERTDAEVRRVFGQVRSVAVEPMPLRSIFLALARDAANRGEGGRQ